MSSLHFAASDNTADIAERIADVHPFTIDDELSHAFIMLRATHLEYPDTAPRLPCPGRKLSSAQI